MAPRIRHARARDDLFGTSGDTFTIELLVNRWLQVTGQGDTTMVGSDFDLGGNFESH
jgi:hypothetical protein